MKFGTGLPFRIQAQRKFSFSLLTFQSETLVCYNTFIQDKISVLWPLYFIRRHTISGRGGGDVYCRRFASGQVDVTCVGGFRAR